MELHFDDFALTIRAEGLDVPHFLQDELLFLTVRTHLLGLLADPLTEIFCFGPAPDNTADGQDELLVNGVFYRIIGYEKNLGIGLESGNGRTYAEFSCLVGTRSDDASFAPANN